MDSLSVTIARVKGVPIRAHLSLIFIFLIFMAPAFSMADPGRLGLSRPQLVALSFATAVVFVFSILLHELGHVFQARREKMQVHGVTLWAFGGMAYLSGGTPSPGQEFRVAAAGPAVTALLAVGLNALVYAGVQGGIRGPALAVADTVGRAQIYLLVFNLIPAFPLDGGRIFMAILWRVRNNLTFAAKTATAAGKGFGVLLMAVGAIGLLSPQLLSLLPLSLRIDSFAGLFIGYMIYSANRSPMAALRPSSADPWMTPGQRGMVVADFMNREFVIAGPEMTIADLLSAMGRLQVRPVALIVKDGQPLGMISRHAAEQVPEAQREAKTIADVMVAKDDIRTVKATDPLPAARRALEDGPETAVVLHDDVVVGLVSVSDVAHAMSLEHR